MESSLHQTCLNHPDREAAAQCPSCKRPYCRECITEHDYKMICANCLSELSAEQGAKSRGFSLPIMPVFQITAAFLILWTVYYQLGDLLIDLSDSFRSWQEWPGFGANG